jgi:hypothetical protein
MMITVACKGFEVFLYLQAEISSAAEFQCCGLNVSSKIHALGI